MRTGLPVSVDDLATDPRAVDPSSLDDWPQLGPMMALPLRSGSGIEGVISLAWTPERIDAFRRLDPRLPTSFAEQAALALQVARSREDRKRMSLLEDRDRIGRDLHDLVIQRLFGVGLGLDSTVRMVPAGEPAQRLRQAIVDIDDTIKDIRRAIFALGTLEGSTDLQTEIEILVDRAAATMKLRPKLRLEGPIRTTVPAAVTPDLLAVVGEALTNVSRHAHASTVEVRVVVDHDTLEVSVADDGRGMPADVLESGLHNLRERAAGHGGELVVESEAGTGTTLTWSVPLVEGGSTIQDAGEPGARDSSAARCPGIGSRTCWDFGPLRPARRCIAMDVAPGSHRVPRSTGAPQPHAALSNDGGRWNGAPGNATRVHGQEEAWFRSRGRSSHDEHARRGGRPDLDARSDQPGPEGGGGPPRPRPLRRACGFGPADVLTIGAHRTARRLPDLGGGGGGGAQDQGAAGPAAGRGRPPPPARLGRCARS